MTLRLNQAYPFYYDSTVKVFKISVILLLITPLFLLLFEPFNINYEEHKFSYPVITIIFGIADSAVFFLTVIAAQKIFPTSIIESRWTLIKELSLWSSVLFCIGITNFLLRGLIYTNPNNLSLAYLLEEIFHSYLLGLLIATLLTLINFTALTISTANKASGWDELVQKLNRSLEKSQSKIVTIRAESQLDEISFNLANLIYVQIDGNYVEFYLKDDEGNTIHHIKRNTLKNVEQQLQAFPNTIRVHRSYLVNCDYITSIEGNAQGYKLSLDYAKQTIPVSRSYISAFDAVMNS